MSNCKHCWHVDGPSISHFTGGTEPVRCCHCGKRGSRPWHMESRRMEGHGEYARQDVRVYGDVDPIPHE